MTPPRNDDSDTTDGAAAAPKTDASNTDGDRSLARTLTRRRALGVVGAGLGIGLGGLAVTSLGGPNDWFLPDALEYAGAGPVAWEIGLREPGPPAVSDGTVCDGTDTGGTVTGGTDTGGTDTGGTGTDGTGIDGMVLVGGSDESDDRSLYALSAASGHVEWRSSVAVAGAPVLEDGTVYAGSWDGEVHALDAANGETQWSQWVGRVTSSSAVDGDGVFVAGDGTVHALDAATGDQRWETEEATVGSHATPAPSGDLVVIGGDDGSVFALSRSDGSVEWEFPTGGARCTGAAVVDDTVYVGANPGSGGEPGVVFALALADGTERWRFETPDDVGSAPTIIDGTVYVGSHDPVYYRGHVHAVDAAKGTEQWSVETAGDVSSAPTVLEGAVYVTNPTASPDAEDDQRSSGGGLEQDDRTFDGRLTVLDGTTGRTLWTFDTGHRVTAPAVSDGTVVFGSGEADQLYAVDATAARE